MTAIPGTFQLDPEDLAVIVPECYAEFRPVVADGLMFFLQYLSPLRLAEIFQAQADLPADVCLLRRLVVFLHACPALHKIGQVLARNRNLDVQLRRHLQELESVEPHMPIDQWWPILARELEHASTEYKVCVSRRILAEGSVAVVVPLTWAERVHEDDAPRHHGVAKLLKPEIEQRLNEDLAILARLGDYVEERCAAYGLPALPYGEILEEVADLLASEVCLSLEQAHLRQAGTQFAGQSYVQVPGVLPFCTNTMTAMERVYGCKLTEPKALSTFRQPTLFWTTARALLSSVLFSRSESMLFHGDPHAGNLLVTHDGRLALLDWSLTGQLTANDRVQLSQILVGGWTRNGARVAAAVADLACAGTGAEIIRGRVASALANISWSKPPGPAWVMDLLDNLARGGVRFPQRLLLFRKAFLTIEGVLSDVCPALSLEAMLMTDGLMRLAWEWPIRCWKTPEDRDYDTHFSNADLIRMALSCARLFDRSAVS